MAVSHIKSNLAPNVTGTVTVFNSLGVTETKAATDLLRPIDWNSVHNQFITIGGNTLNASTASGSNIIFQGGGNISLFATSDTLIFSGSQSVQTQGSVSVQGSQGAIVFSNSNGISFGGNASTITASHNGLTTAAQSNHSHGNPTLALTNLSGTTASNSAGLTLSLSAAAAGGGGPAISAAGGSASTGTIVFSNSNGVSFGWNAGTITATVTPGAAAGIAAAAAGTQQATSGTVTFVNSNGLTFGMSGSSQITASHNGLTTARASNDAIGLNTALTANGVAWTVNSSGLSLNVPAFLTTAAQSNHSHGNPTLALTNLSGTTASNSAGLTLSLSAAAPGGAASATLYATGNTTQSSSGTMALSSMIVQGTGGVSAGITNGSIVVSGPALTSLSVTGALSASSNGSTISLGVGTVTVSATSNTTQGSSGTVNLNGLIFAGAGGASVGVSNGSIVISGATGGAGGGVAVANSQTTYTSGTVHLSAAGALTIESTTGQSYRFSVPATSSLSAVGNLTISTNGNTISFSVGTAAAAPVEVSAGTTSGSLSRIVFSDSNGITFGLNGSTITASHNGLTTARASNDAIGLNSAFTAGPLLMTINSSGLSLNAASAAGTTSGFTGGASISGSMTHNTAGLAISLSHPAWITTAALSDHSHGNPTLALTNLSGTTASNSAGLTLSLSAAAPGAGGGVAISAGTQSVSTGTVNWANSNGITFGMSGSSQITASYNSTQFAGTGTTFAGANISASMTLNSAGFNLSASVAAPGAAAENNAINLLGANTAGNTTATGSTIGWSGVNLTLSGTNASQVVISAPATSSIVGASGISISTAGSTVSVYGLPSANMEIFELGNTAFSTMGQGTIYFQQFIPKQNVTFGNIERRMSGSSVSSTNNQVAAHTYRYGLYSRETGANSSRYTQIGASSIYFAASFNSNTGAGWTVSQGAASVTNTSAGTVNLSAITGLKHLYFPFAGTVTEGGQYAIAMWMSSATTGGTSPLRIGVLEMTHINNLTIGRVDTAAGFSISNASRIGDFGQGVYSSSSSNLPASIAVSGFTNAVSQARMYLQLD
jgi:fibronectin-binding autotransporter adhesin